MSASSPTVRKHSFGERYTPGLVDRFGVWLSAQKIKKYVKNFKEKKCGDFGCGYNATFFRTIMPVVGPSVLVDVKISPDFRDKQNVTALEGQLIEILPTVESSSLDVIMNISVLEHLWTPQTALEHFHRILKPGGLLLLNVPSWKGKFFLEFSAFKLGLSPSCEMNDHKMYYDKKDLWPLLVRAGFRPQMIQLSSYKFGLNTFAVCQKASDID